MVYCIFSFNEVKSPVICRRCHACVALFLMLCRQLYVCVFRSMTVQCVDNHDLPGRMCVIL